MCNDYMYIHDDFLLFHHLLGELHKDDLTKFLDSPWADCSKAIHQSRIPNLSTHFFYKYLVWFLFQMAFKKKFVKQICENISWISYRTFHQAFSWWCMASHWSHLFGLYPYDGFTTDIYKGKDSLSNIKAHL